MGDLSAHFSRSEFTCGHCGALVGPTAQLLGALERLRAAVGKPLRIVSGYRCPVWNARVGGIRSSRHLRGDAVDIPGGYATVSQCRAAGLVGIGVRAGRVVHVDMTPGRRTFVFDD